MEIKYKFLLPTFNSGLNEFQHGLLLDMPHACKRALYSGNSDDSIQCIDHYKKCSNIKGFHICPKGFTTYVYSFNRVVKVFSGIIVPGYSNIKKIKQSQRLDTSYKLSASKVKRIVSNDLINYHKAHELDSSKLSFQSRFHDIRKIAKIVQRESKAIKALHMGEQGNLKVKYDKLSDKNYIMKKLKSIGQLTRLMQQNFKLFDSSLNPNVSDYGNFRMRNVTSQFHEMRQCMHGYANMGGRNIRLRETKKQEWEYEILDTFDLIPFILYENAIKYSKQNGEVITEVSIGSKSNIIKVTSESYYDENLDLENIFKANYRGGVSSEQSSGSGLGLYLAKFIATKHNINISAYYSDKTYEDDGNVFSVFTVKLEFPIAQ